MAVVSTVVTFEGVAPVAVPVEVLLFVVVVSVLPVVAGAASTEPPIRLVAGSVVTVLTPEVVPVADVVPVVDVVQVLPPLPAQPPACDVVAAGVVAVVLLDVPVVVDRAAVPGAATLLRAMPPAGALVAARVVAAASDSTSAGSR
ncbi:MAG TPA: hypothetical protein VNU21_21015 [Usitatibacter sp.]|nr:hypothetical protein [Usitatibacter sp.]